MTIAYYHLYGNPNDPRWMGYPLDRDSYSYMKHGSVGDIEDFGLDLIALVKGQLTFIGHDAKVTLPVAYQHVKPACWYLAEELRKHLVNWGVDAEIVKISKSSVTIGDYAGGTAEDRAKEMGRIQFTLDGSVEDTNVILVDDIKITGLAERTAVEAIMKGHPRSISPIYVADIDPVLAQNPGVEKTLNHWAVDTILDMVPYIQNDEFVLTIRFLKRVLGSDEDTVAQFSKAIGPRWCDEFIKGAEGTGPEFVASYRKSLDIMEDNR